MGTWGAISPENGSVKTRSSRNAGRQAPDGEAAVSLCVEAMLKIFRDREEKRKEVSRVSEAMKCDVLDLSRNKETL